jgi:hypothetical protein
VAFLLLQNGRRTMAAEAEIGMESEAAARYAKTYAVAAKERTEKGFFACGRVARGKKKLSSCFCVDIFFHLSVDLLP